jgi:hypothetical protein
LIFEMVNARLQIRPEHRSQFEEEVVEDDQERGVSKGPDVHGIRDTGHDAVVSAT